MAVSRCDVADVRRVQANPFDGGTIYRINSPYDTPILPAQVRVFPAAGSVTAAATGPAGVPWGVILAVVAVAAYLYYRQQKKRT